MKQSQDRSVLNRIKHFKQLYAGGCKCGRSERVSWMDVEINGYQILLRYLNLWM